MHMGSCHVAIPAMDGLTAGNRHGMAPTRPDPALALARHVPTRQITCIRNLTPATVDGEAHPTAQVTKPPWPWDGHRSEGGVRERVRLARLGRPPHEECESGQAYDYMTPAWTKARLYSVTHGRTDGWMDGWMYVPVKESDILSVRVISGENYLVPCGWNSRLVWCDRSTRPSVRPSVRWSRGVCTNATAALLKNVCTDVMSNNNNK